MTNEELAKAARQGNQGALPQLWEATRALLFAFAWKFYTRQGKDRCAQRGVALEKEREAADRLTGAQQDLEGRPGPTAGVAAAGLAPARGPVPPPQPAGGRAHRVEHFPGNPTKRRGLCPGHSEQRHKRCLRQDSNPKGCAHPGAALFLFYE